MGEMMLEEAVTQLTNKVGVLSEENMALRKAVAAIAAAVGITASTVDGDPKYDGSGGGGSDDTPESATIVAARAAVAALGISGGTILRMALATPAPVLAAQPTSCSGVRFQVEHTGELLGPMNGPSSGAVLKGGGQYSMAQYRLRQDF